MLFIGKSVLYSDLPSIWGRARDHTREAAFPSRRVSVLLVHAVLLCPPSTQRPAPRRRTASSVRLRSWWRRSSRRPACGRARATAGRCSWRTKTPGAEPAAATAPCFKPRDATAAHVNIYTPKPPSLSLSLCLSSWAELSLQTVDRPPLRH